MASIAFGKIGERLSGLFLATVNGRLRAAHPARLPSRGFATLLRNSAISIGPSENSPALALAVRILK